MNERSHVVGETRLWRAFLDQTLFDVYFPVEEERHEHDAAKHWLHDRTGQWDPDFDTVCELAGVEPDWVEMVMRKLEEGRLPNGEPQKNS